MQLGELAKRLRRATRDVRGGLTQQDTDDFLQDIGGVVGELEELEERFRPPPPPPPPPLSLKEAPVWFKEFADNLRTQLNADHRQIYNQLGDIMAKFDDVKTQAEQNTAALLKSNEELKSVIAKQGDIDKVIQEAVDKARAEGNTEMEAKLDELKAIQDEQSKVLAGMDAQVEDKA